MWLRQGGKTTTLANQGLLEMAEHKNRLITFVSASLNIGSEFIEKEAQTWSIMLEEFRDWAEKRKMKIIAGERSSEDADSFKQMPDNINLDDLANALERSKFEIRLKHSNTTYSRTKVIAPNIATARSWSGSVKFDEVAFVRDLRILLAELEPVFSTDPFFTFIMATTPPPDTAHYAYELMTPADGNEDFEISKDGNWFKNRAGLWVHRVTVDDAAASGRKIYNPETGEEQTADEAREMSIDKEGWDRSNRLTRPLTGTSAISPGALDTAQRKGKNITVGREWPLPPQWWDNVGKGPLAIGVDPATTEGKKSNPTGLALVEEIGLEYIARALTWYKLADPKEARQRIVDMVDILISMGYRNQLRGVSVDATNERYWARELKDELPVPVTLTGGGDAVEYLGEKMNFKFYSGSLLSNNAEAGRVILPEGRYIYDDFARVTKSRGTFVAPVGANGEHADTFDAVRQAMSLLQGSGPVEISGVPVGNVAGWHQDRVDHDDPLWLRATNKAKSFFS